MTRREDIITTAKEIEEILSKETTMHIALSQGDQPYVFPMNYGYIFNDDKLTFYVHGSRKGYKYEILSENTKTSFSIETDITPFEADVACKYGVSYRMVYGMGTATNVTDVEEKKKALTLLMKNQAGKDFEFTDKLASVVGVIRVDINKYWAKSRPVPTRP